MSLLERVQAQWNARKAEMGEEAGLLLGISGGVDSMVLAALFVALRRANAVGLSLTLAHFNHQLRGEDSDADEALVRRYAEAEGLACVVGSADVAACAQRSGETVEEAARRLRYRFFCETARAVGARVIVLAHHQKDQAESLLLHLLRGAGLDGLCGMQELEWRADWGLYLWRPLLKETKETLCAWADTHAVSWRLDSTNDDRRFLRNYLRHELLPRMEEVQPQAEAHLVRTSELLQADREALAEWTQAAWTRWVRRGAAAGRNARLLDAYEVEGEAFCRLPVSIQRRLLRRLVESLQKSRSLSFAQLEEIRALFFLESGKYRVIYGMMFLSDAASLLAFRKDVLSIPAPISLRGAPPDGTVFPWRVGRDELVYHEVSNFPAKEDLVRPERCYFDAETAFPLVVRAPKQGEVLRRFSGETRLIRRLFNDYRVAVPLRRSWPLVASGERVLSVAGLARSGEHVLTEQTKKIAYLEWRLL